MIQFKNFRQYTQIVDGIRFPKDKKRPFLIIYLSENSLLYNDISKLNFRIQDLRHIIIPTTTIPRTRLTSAIKSLFQKQKFYALSSLQKPPQGVNLLIDYSTYLNEIDKIYKPKTYRQRSGILMTTEINKTFSLYPKDYQKILLYSIDATKKFPPFIERKSFKLLLDLKEELFQFDHFILNIINEENSKYRLLVKDKDFLLAKVKEYIKNIYVISDEEEKEQDLKNATNNIIDKVKNNIIPGSVEKVKGSVKDFLSKDKSSFKKALTGKISKDNANKITSTSILQSTSGDINKSKRIVSIISPSNQDKALKVISKKFKDELLEKQKTISTTTDPILNEINLPNVVDNKSPEHIFEKRKADFDVNLKKDMLNLFKVLEEKEIPLKVQSLEIIDKPQRSGEIKKSDERTIIIVLLDEFGKKHKVKIDIPKIRDDGTFYVNGQKKALINQIVLNPISFPKEYDSKFESSYSTFHLISKRTKREKYLQLNMSGKLPFLIVLSFAFGFDKTLNDYGIKYYITKIKPKKDIPFFSKINDKDFIVFENVNTDLKKELCQSFLHVKISELGIEKPFGDKEFFNEVIYKLTGRINTTFYIQLNLDNIVDPISKQILLNKQLPTDLFYILKYMATKVVEGYFEKRNDISNQRIKNAEVITHLTQKLVLASYTVYKEQVLSGNKEADFEIPQGKVLNDFIRTEIVTNMEYANPAEEMATLTRVSPVGKAVGGIPDKEAIQLAARNVSESYFGNIDPLDTPEGPNVGIVQQLTVDAFISSSRGLFNVKEINDNENSGMLSTSSVMIPFVENNDGPRVMFGVNQSRQSVPLVNPEPPVIQSGYESILTNVLSDSFIKKSPCDGKVLKITNDIIKIKCKDGKEKIIEINPVHLKSGSGKNTLSIFDPTIKEGQSVKNKQIIAEGSSIKNGTISMGRTLCTAFLPYNGYNFEDGIVISESVIKNNKLTSIHGIEEEFEISEKDRLAFIVDLKTKTKKGDPLIKKTSGEIEELIGFDEEEQNIERIGNLLVLKSPGGIIVDIEVFSNVDKNKFPLLISLIEKTDKRYKKPEKQKYTIKGVPIKGILVKFIIEQEMPMGVGDKMTNRHGAKGVIALVEKEENMPLTPWGDRVEIILNPIGIVNRMNMGQLFELYMGLISKELALRIIKLKNKEKIISLFQKVLPLLDRTKNKELSTKFIANFSKLNKTNFDKLIEDINNKKFMSLIIPPFKGPKKSDIIKALKVLDLKSEYKLKLPEYNTTMKNGIPVGYIYFYKLEHIASEKVYARSTGPRVSKTLQPTAGKKLDGGQRLGELDTYSFLSFNATTTLSELMGSMSDDQQSKNEMLSEILETGTTTFHEAKTSPARDLLNFYFMAMMLERK